MSEYLIARHLGGRPVPVDATFPASARAQPRPGAVTAIELAPGRAGRRALLRDIARIERGGERLVSVRQLLAERAA